MALPATPYISGPQQNHVMRAPIGRDRIFPFTLRPWMSHSGLKPDPVNPGEYLYIRRRRYIDSTRHAYGWDPGHTLPGPVGLGRLTFDNKQWCPECLRPEGSPPAWNAGWPYIEMVKLPPNPNADPPHGWLWECPECGYQMVARAAPPRLVPRFFAKFRMIDSLYSPVTACLGGKIERGVLVKGGVSLIQRTATDGTPRPPHFLPWAFYSEEMTGVPDSQPDPLYQMCRDAENAADVLEADQWTCLVLYPVWPVQAWPEEMQSLVPYPEGAENAFAFNDAYNREVPCYPRAAPWRHIGSAEHAFLPMIPGGQRLIIAESLGEPQLALSRAWFEWSAASYWWCVEHYIRRFRGCGAPTFHKWTADPQQRGWGVMYQSWIWAWFVSSHIWHWTPDAAVAHWNLWYRGEVRMQVTGGGDLDDPLFRAWVESLDSGYGLHYEPRYCHCNDVLLECAGIEKALGDVIAPLEAVQDEALEYGDTPPPCKEAGLGPSYWYVADRPLAGAGSEIPPSLHPVSGVAQWPETGLIHEIKRRLLDRNGDVAETQYAWGIVQLTTGVPRINVVGTSELRVQNEIQQIIIECGDTPPDGGWILVDRQYDLGMAVYIYWSATIEQTNEDVVLTWTAVAPPYGLSGSWPGNPPVVVTRPSPCVWQIEWINDEAAKDQPDMSIVDAYLTVGGAETEFDVRIVTVQHGGRVEAV